MKKLLFLFTLFLSVTMWAQNFTVFKSNYLYKFVNDEITEEKPLQPGFIRAYSDKRITLMNLDGTDETLLARYDRFVDGVDSDGDEYTIYYSLNGEGNVMMYKFYKSLLLVKNLSNTNGTFIVFVYTLD